MSRLATQGPPRTLVRGERASIHQSGVVDIPDKPRFGSLPSVNERRTSATETAAAGIRPDGPPWLLGHRVELPDPVAGYVERPALEERCAPLARRLTVLQAPGGFGKTALLAHVCRKVRGQGDAVAWLAFSETDTPIAVATYLALAFERAGLEMLDGFRPDGVDPGSSATGGREADSQATYWINLLVRRIESHPAPCLLALDEVERLDNPDSVAVLNEFLRAAPRNLHLAMAFRTRPPGLDIAMFMLEGRGLTVGTEELRFATPDIARFFGTELSRRELAEAAASSAGWPIALRIYRNAGLRSTSAQPGGESDTAAAWIESRLWRGLSEDDRDLVLDMALFDWIDTTLIDEATGIRNSRRRIESMESLAGLVESRGRESTLHLHPLLRDYCATRRFREDPDRYRSIHAGIARALATRGQVVDALRHAAEAGDADLIADIAEDAGGIKIWFRGGSSALRAVDGWLTSELVATHPRLALVRCVVLAMSGDVAGAGRLYHTAVAGRAGLDGPGGDDPALRFDDFVVRGMLLVFGCSTVARYEPLVAAGGDFAGEHERDPLLRSCICHGMNLTLNERTEFEEARDWGERARAELGDNTLYLSPLVDYLAGLGAMAQGRIDDARTCYARALQAVRARRLGDAGTTIIGNVLMAELELERGAGTPRVHATPVSSRLLSECGAWLDLYAANTGVAAELALHHGGDARALAVVDAALEFARRTQRPALVRFLSAMRVSRLVEMDRADEAERIWRGAELPRDTAGCLDLNAHRWREVEAFAMARVRLLVARGDFESARELAGALRRFAAERRLARTHLRALALSMRLESLAGCADSAAAHVAGYLRLYAQAPYARPLARERELALPLLQRIADSDDAEIASGAGAMHGDLTAADAQTPVRVDPDLTAAELEVLRRLDRHSDKEIARRLDLSYDAVRYRIRSVFGKLGARGRHDAVHRARSLGILPPEVAG